METDFRNAKVGDRVWEITEGWGKITEIIGQDEGKTLAVKFDGGGEDEYWDDGKHYATDINPSLFWDEIKITPPPRPKRKVMRTVEVWYNAYSPPNTYCVYNTKGAADTCADNERRIACVKLTGEFEVEE